MAKPHFFNVNVQEWTPHPRISGVLTKLLQNQENSMVASVLLAKVEVGGVIENHKHEYETETAYVLSGKGRFISGGEETLLEVGCGVTIPPGITHELYNAGKEPLLLYAFHIPPAY